MTPAWPRGAVLLAAVLLTIAPSALGQPADFDPHPLRPADTSSPRATLRSFQTNARAAAQALRALGEGELFVYQLQLAQHADMVPFTRDYMEPARQNCWAAKRLRIFERYCLFHACPSARRSQRSPVSYGLRLSPECGRSLISAPQPHPGFRPLLSGKICLVLEKGQGCPV